MARGAAGAFPEGIEAVRRGRARPGRSPALLVHGAWHGAWCWDGPVMDRLARDREVVAVSLRGHGGSRGRGPVARRLHGLSGYGRDVAAAAASLDAPPVVVGHSMGALVVQRLLGSGLRARGAALVAPAPVGGVLPLFLRLLRRDPAAVARAVATWSCKPVVGDPVRAGRLLLAPDADAAEAAALHARLGDESFLAFLGMLAPRVAADRCRVPVAVFAAGRDGTFTAEEAARTAAAFRAPLETLPGCGHDAMVGAGAADLAERLADWCDRLDGVRRRAAAPGARRAA